jgi:hypothetical protein
LRYRLSGFPNKRQFAFDRSRPFDASGAEFLVKRFLVSIALDSDELEKYIQPRSLGLLIRALRGLLLLVYSAPIPVFADDRPSTREREEIIETPDTPQAALDAFKKHLEGEGFADGWVNDDGAIERPVSGSSPTPLFPPGRSSKSKVEDDSEVQSPSRPKAAKASDGQTANSGAGAGISARDGIARRSRHP